MNAMSPRAVFRQRERGSSVAEFAIIVPVMVMLMMFANFFHDAWQAKLKLQESARFVAWEFTSLPLSDYANGNHDTLFTQAKSKITQDVQRMYVDFDSAEPGTAAVDTWISKHTFENAQLKITNETVPLVSNETLSNIPGLGSAGGSIGSLANRGLNMLESQFRFNGKGMIVVEVGSTYVNRLVSRTLFPQALRQFAMKDKIAIVADGWAVHDGRDVHTRGSGDYAADAEPVRKNSSFAKQVGRMKFMGLTNLIPQNIQNAMGSVDGLVGAVGLVNPLLGFGAEAPVVAVNYTNDNPTSPRPFGNGNYTCGGSGAPNHGMISLAKDGREIDMGVNCHHTLPYRVTRDYNASPLDKVFRKSGRFYMRCEQAEAITPVGGASSGTGACR